MVTMAQSATNWRKAHTHVDRTHFTSTQLQPRGAKRQISYYRIWNQIFILEVPERGRTRRKPPTCDDNRGPHLLTPICDDKRGLTPICDDKRGTNLLTPVCDDNRGTH